MNSPVFLLIDIKYSIYYAVALIITLIGLYFVGTYYKNNYGSPNYAGISGLAIATPFIGFVLRVYLISLALYPPFPNAVFLFNSFIKNETGYFWYVVFGIVLFSNFFIAMRILTNTVFGKPNKIIFYKDIKGKERLGHFFIILLLTIWGLNGITEVLK
jgi:NADH:ubiquinone oxidoreductase subunit 2 (subunit N)